MELKRKWNGFELHSESVGNQWGTHMELVWNWLANPMFSFWTVWGMQRGCWGRSGEFIRGFIDFNGFPLIYNGYQKISYEYEWIWLGFQWTSDEVHRVSYGLNRFLMDFI